MALLERVSTLVRANLNDLIDKAEDPEKMLKQVILDMQNQLLQVKTQVALALADQHLLDKKQKENEAKASDWMRRAEFAVDKQQEDLARAAIERCMSYSEMSEKFGDQLTDQRMQVESLKNALRKLEHKQAEAQAKCDLLLAQHRRARALNKASDLHGVTMAGSKDAAFDRVQGKVSRSEALSQAKTEIAGRDNMEERLEKLEKQEKIDLLLAGIKSRKALPN